MNTAPYRLENVMLYLLCIPLVYVLTSWIWKYFRPEESGNARWVAVAVTSLFVLHPSHTEAVVWISGRKDVLSTLFSLFALWFAVKAKREKGIHAGYASTTLIFLVAAMLSKASSVAVAPVIALIWILFWQDMRGTHCPGSIGAYLLLKPARG